jgi:hypothetical protein
MLDFAAYKRFWILHTPSDAAYEFVSYGEHSCCNQDVKAHHWCIDSTSQTFQATAVQIRKSIETLTIMSAASAVTGVETAAFADIAAPIQ